MSNAPQYLIQAAHYGQNDWRDVTPARLYDSLSEAQSNVRFGTFDDYWMWEPGLHFRIVKQFRELAGFDFRVKQFREVLPGLGWAAGEKEWETNRRVFPDKQRPRKNRR